MRGLWIKANKLTFLQNQSKNIFFDTERSTSKIKEVYSSTGYACRTIDMALRTGLTNSTISLYLFLLRLTLFTFSYSRIAFFFHSTNNRYCNRVWMCAFPRPPLLKNTELQKVEISNFAQIENAIIRFWWISINRNYHWSEYFRFFQFLKTFSLCSTDCFYVDSGTW